MKKCDPFKESELYNVNTPVCEQVFTKINRHRNCKSMNKARYFMFWFYNIDLHNLDVEGLDSSVPDPWGEFRRTQFKVIPVDFMNLPNKQTEQVHELSKLLSSLKVKSSEKRSVKCTLCGAGYKMEGYLKLHMKEKHNDIKDDKKAEYLECGKILFNKQSLEKQILAMHTKVQSLPHTIQYKDGERGSY